MSSLQETAGELARANADSVRRATTARTGQPSCRAGETTRGVAAKRGSFPVGAEAGPQSTVASAFLRRAGQCCNRRQGPVMRAHTVTVAEGSA